MYCYKCGKEVIDGAGIRPHCGAELKKKPSKKTPVFIAAAVILVLALAFILRSVFSVR